LFRDPRQPVGGDAADVRRQELQTARAPGCATKGEIVAIGPIQALVIGFPDNDRLEGRVAEELAALSDVGLIRIIDAVFVLREGDEVDIIGISDLDDEQRAELRATVAALIGLGVAGEEGAVAGAMLGMAADPDATIAAAVADDLAEDLPDGSSALVLAVEHLWAVPLRDAVRDAGGVVVANTSITAENLIALGLDIGEAELDD
jgi:uncharacterized membrane protein